MDNGIIRKDTMESSLSLLRAHVADLPAKAKILAWGAESLRLLAPVIDEAALVVCYESDSGTVERYKREFAFLGKRLVFRRVSREDDPRAGEYCPLHPYVKDPLDRFGENFFDIAVAGGDAYRTDCIEMGILLVKDAGLILCPGAVSFLDPFPDMPGRRMVSDVLGRFEECFFFDDEATAVVRNRKISQPYGGSEVARRKWVYLKALFLRLAEEGIPYVVLRNMDAIPVRCSREDGIGLLVPPADFGRVHAIVNLANFTDGFFGAGPGSGPDSGGGVLPDRRYVSGYLDLCMDVGRNLYHRGADGEPFALCGRLQASMFARRRFVNGVANFLPGYADLFIHILCRVIFDERETSARHAMRLEALLPLLDRESVLGELGLVFHGFAGQALDLVARGESDRLFERYRASQP